MRSSSLRKVLRGIVASVVPLGTISGCSAFGGEDCTGTDGQFEKFLTFSNDGALISVSDAPPATGDAGPDAMPEDAGTDAAIDASGPRDCMDRCAQVYLGGCGGFSIRGCATIGQANDQVFVRCDLESHRVCLPHGAVCGRRPAGLSLGARRGRRAAHPLGKLFSDMASLEAASVPAFRVLARELEAHGSPRALCREAIRAAGDEVRHTRIMCELARRHGGRRAVVRVPRRGVRALPDIAVENCVEGCVRETFGALVATWQAREARDSEVRRAMKSIARDEVRHAALAFRIAAWTSPRLDRIERARVESARQRAIADLRKEFGTEPARELVDAAGLPSSRDALRLLDEMTRALWGARA